jgi:hypothetical protein
MNKKKQEYSVWQEALKLKGEIKTIEDFHALPDSDKEKLVGWVLNLPDPLDISNVVIRLNERTASYFKCQFLLVIFSLVIKDWAKGDLLIRLSRAVEPYTPVTRSIHKNDVAVVLVSKSYNILDAANYAMRLLEDEEYCLDLKYFTDDLESFGAERYHYQ